MIYTVTFSPCLDLHIFVDKFSLGKTNRAKKSEISVGGKGINVSLMLKNLRVNSTALGFVSGFTGKEIKKSLKGKIKTDFVFQKAGNSRINIKLDGKTETEINSVSPEISFYDLKKLLKKLKKAKKGDFLVISGSIPKSRQKILEQIFRLKEEKGLNVVLDSCYENRKEIINFAPFLLKPNEQELFSLLGERYENPTDYIPSLRSLVNSGIENIIASFGEKGAVFVDREKAYFCPAFKGKVINTVGAGDSMVAGFLSKAEGTKKDAFLFSAACGSATAFSKNLATEKQIRTLLKTPPEIIEF